MWPSIETRGLVCGRVEPLMVGGLITVTGRRLPPAPASCPIILPGPVLGSWSRSYLTVTRYQKWFGTTICCSQLEGKRQ